MNITPSKPDRRILFQLFARRIRLTSVVILLNIVSMFGDGIGLMLLIPLLGSLTSEATTGDFTEKIISFLIELGMQPKLGNIIVLFLIIISLRAVFQAARDCASVRLRTLLVDDLRHNVMAALLKAEWSWVSQHKDSKHANLLLTELKRAGVCFYSALSLLTTISGLGAFLFVALCLDPTRGAVILAITIGLLAAFAKFRRHAGLLGHEEMQVNEILHNTTQEIVSSLKLSKILGSQASQLNSFSTTAKDLRHNQIRFALVSSIARELFICVGAVLMAGYVYLGVSLWQISLAELLVMVVILARLIPMLSACQQQLQRLANTHPSLDAVQKLIADAKLWEEPIPPACLPTIHPKRSVALKNVTLRYQPDMAPALNQVNIELPFGSITMVSGQSGAGKTTLADVLMGIFLPDDGILCIDDKPLDTMQRVRWRQSVSYVPQEVTIYSGTLRSNLARAYPTATDFQMNAALMAAAADFTQQWPAGLDTLIGPGGRQLSGGERQRLALARGILRQPCLLILDEVTSSLDPENEAAICNSLERLAGKVTIVILGHRTAFSSIATKHYVLNAGNCQLASVHLGEKPKAWTC